MSAPDIYLKIHIKETKTICKLHNKWNIKVT